MAAIVERYTQVVLRFRRTILVAFLIATVGAFAALPLVNVQTSIRDFLGANSQALRDYDAFIEKFGGNASILVAIRSDKPLDNRAMEALRAIETEISRKLHVQHIDSVSNLRVSDNRSLPLWKVVAPGRLGAESSKRIGDRAARSGALLSKDLKIVGLTVTPWLVPASRLTSPPPGAAVVFDCNNAACEAAYLKRLVDEVERISGKHESANLHVSVIGSSVLNKYLIQGTMKSMATLFLACLLVIAIVLWFLFRRIVPVVICVAAMLSSIVWGIAALAVTGTSMSAVFQLFPAFLLVVGVAFTVHLLSAFYRVEDGDETPADAVVRSMTVTAKPILAAALTTIFGMLCFGVASVPPVAQFGVFSALGVAFALLISLLVVPAVLASLPQRWLRRRGSVEPAPSRMVKLLTRVCGWAAQKPAAALFVIVPIILLASFGVTQLHVKHDPIDWLPANHPVRIDVERLNNAGMNGFVIEVLADSGRAGAATGPAFLSKIAAFEKAARALTIGPRRVMGVRSMVDLSSTSGTVTSTLIRQLTVNRFSDRENRIARIQVKIPWTGQLEIQAFQNALHDIGKTIFGQGNVTITGKAIIISAMAEALISSLIMGYVLAAGFILIILMLWLRRWKLIVVGVAVNGLPLLAVLGLVGWAGMPVDIYLLMVGVIVVSIAVDDTLHLLANFESKYLAERRDVGAAIKAQIEEVGKGILFTTLLIALGFATFALSDMNNLANFGLVVAFGAIVAFICDILIAPALLTLLMRAPKRVGNVDASAGQATLR